MFVEKCNIVISLLKEKLNDKLSSLEKRNESECSDLTVLNSSVQTMKKTLHLCETIHEESLKKSEEKMINSYVSTEPSRDKSSSRKILSKNTTVSNFRKDKSMPREISSKDVKDKSMVRNKTILNINNETDSSRKNVETKTPRPMTRNMTVANLNKTPSKTSSKTTPLQSDAKNEKMKRNPTVKTITTLKESKDSHRSKEPDITLDKSKIIQEEKNGTHINDNNKEDSKVGAVIHDKRPSEIKFSNIVDLEPMMEEEELINHIQELSVKKEDIQENKEFIQINILKILDDKWTFFSKYFNIRDYFKISLVCKKFSSISNKHIIGFIQTELEKTTMKIKILTDKHSVTDLTEKQPAKFALTRGASKAVELLNESLYAKIFNENNIPNEDILMVYRLIFYLTDRSDYASIQNVKEFWSKCCNYFTNLPNGQIGKAILDSIPNLNFSNENIFKMSRIVVNSLHKITPTYFSKMCGTTGLFLFLLKDAFEFCGIINDSKKTPPYNAYKFEKYVKELYQKIIEKMKKIQLISEKN